MKQVSQDTLIQSIALLKQGKCILEVEDFTGLSKSTLGKLQKIHCYGFEKPKGNCPKVLSSADERYCVYKMIKSRVPSAVKVVKELERILKKKCRKDVQNLHGWKYETKINRFNSDGRIWAWARMRKSVKFHHVMITVKHGGDNIMLWSAITYAEAGCMYKINGTEGLN
ncbi:hypothetical protein G6F18_010157 [Rhizopus arrhizus]|nr:hypothetical protein G6F24_009803 [Rhizopus arrhizus]KAG0788194.1 hypothetical protein G6F21_007383 [Rhizopus arrhizus]KAG0804859.1 hypothetical protein G6F20_012365 [Rhizopus arrhizus]KAG0826019.1 hypothetical protein G6F18_010157 [Rhizopus arrhizus]KAG0906313.1 hypothetical protein G6F33_011483 [Rhizopus arrhizus]